METSSTSAAVETARMLVDAHARNVTFRPFAAENGITNTQAAYAVQRQYVQLQSAARGVGASGYKIGLTSARMQEMCGIDSPIAGIVLSDRLSESGASLPRANFGRLGLEFEVAVKMARDLGRSGSSVSLHDVAEAVGGVAPAIEIVDDRNCDYQTLDVLSLIADNAWNAGVVLGAFQSAWPDLAEVEGIVSKDGAKIDRGLGRDVLGHPFQSVAWLAGHLAEAGSLLRAGDIVMTGNLVTTYFPQEACRYRFELMGLGAVELTVG